MRSADILDLYDTTAHRNPRTRQGRVIAARQLVEWCDSNSLPFPLIGEVDAHRYLEYRRSVGNSQSTVASKLQSLKHFYRWMVSRGLVDRSPFEGIASNAEAPKPRATLTAAELRNLWEAAPTPAHRALIGLIGFAGLGIEEVSALDVADFQQETSGYFSVRVQSRPATRGHMQALLPPEVASAVNDTLGTRRSGPLLPRPDAPNERLTRWAITRMTRQCGKRAAVPFPVTPGALAFTVRALAIQHGFSYIGVVRAIGEMHPSKARRWIDGGSFRPEQHAAVRLGRLVFDDPESTLGLLSEASVLLNESALPPAVAVMAAGAALERHLRELSVDRRVLESDSATKDRTLSSYAQGLIKHGHIDRSVHKQVELIAGWRNDAAHGWFDRVNAQIAESTIRTVREIVETHPVGCTAESPHSAERS